MKRGEPPSLATWMLRQLTSDRDEALHGDLLEEFHSGRSKSWFWRQVIRAVLMDWMLSYFRRRVVLVFAVAWSLLSPAGLVVFSEFEERKDFAGFIWRIPWPWSTLCDFSWTALKHLTLVWIGALAYITVLAILRRKVSILSLVTGTGAGIIGYCAASACWIAAVTLMQPTPVLNAADWHTLTLWNAIVKVGLTGIAPCIPDVVAMMCTLWGTEAGSKYPASLAV